MTKLPPSIELKLRATIKNKGRRRRMAKKIARMLERTGTTRPVSQVYSEHLERKRQEGEIIVNRAARRGHVTTTKRREGRSFRRYDVE